MSLTELAQNLIKEKFDSIEYAADATCGNGYDTLFLAGLCSPDGMIFSFDIQEEALDKAEKLLADNNITQSVMLVNSGHENMEKILKPRLDIVMFNLGYLPNSESKICTKGETTLRALNSASIILREGGMITILCYPGTEKGKNETKEVRKWLDDLDKKYFNVLEYLSEKPNDTTPVLFVIERSADGKILL